MHFHYRMHIRKYSVTVDNFIEQGSYMGKNNKQKILFLSIRDTMLIGETDMMSGIWFHNVKKKEWERWMKQDGKVAKAG